MVKQKPRIEEVVVRVQNPNAPMFCDYVRMSREKAEQLMRRKRK